jgi:phosphate-selective porin OprO/OprP
MSKIAFAGALLCLLTLARAHAQNSDSTALAQRVRALEERVAQLERQREHGDSATAKGPPPGGPRGFYLRSADGAFQLRLRGLLQADTRLVENAPPSATTLLLRRARPFLEATMYRIVDVRLIPDFGLNTAVIQDANVDLRLRPWFVIRGGKFKTPIGLERLQPVADIVFVERSLLANFSPSRDVGLQVSARRHVAPVGRWRRGRDRYDGAGRLPTPVRKRRQSMPSLRMRARSV